MQSVASTAPSLSLGLDLLASPHPRATVMQLDPFTCWKALACRAVVMLALGSWWDQGWHGAEGRQELPRAGWALEVGRARGPLPCSGTGMPGTRGGPRLEQGQVLMDVI